MVTTATCEGLQQHGSSKAAVNDALTIAMGLTSFPAKQLVPQLLCSSCLGARLAPPLEALALLQRSAHTLHMHMHTRSPSFKHETWKE